MRSNADLVPTEGYASEHLMQVEELFSHSSYDTIMTGIATDVLLLVEDRRARGFAAAIGAKWTSWTQPLLMKLQHEGGLSHDRYIELISRLVQQKVGFVAIGAADLYRAANLGYDAQDFQSLCDAVMRDNVDPASLVQVASDFIAALWNTGAPSTPRLCSEVLQRALTRKDGLKLFRAIIVLVHRNISDFGFPMRLLARLWSKYVDRFVDGHFIREALLAPPQLPTPAPARRKSRKKRG